MRSFNERERRKAMVKAIDEALRMFGEGVRSVVFYYCEAKHGFKPEELDQAEKLALFAKLIKEIFGPASKLLEDQVLARLCSTLGVDRSRLPKEFKDALIYLAKLCPTELEAKTGTKP